MHEQIVRKIYNKDITADDSYSKSVNQLVEPCLLPKQRKLLPCFPIMDLSDSFSQFLVKRVRRNPRDLHAHVQRTLLYISKNDTDAIYAALIDLFLILGSRGSHIRKNLLGKAMPFLQDDQYQFLATHLDNGLHENDPLPSKTVSSLSKGHSGTTHIVRRKAHDSSPSSADPLEQAAELNRQNDSLTAMAILEHALHHDPGNESVCRELLSLYKQQRARKPFYKTYTGIFGRCFGLPELWRETDRFFLESTHD